MCKCIYAWFLFVPTNCFLKPDSSCWSNFSLSLIDKVTIVTYIFVWISVPCVSCCNWEKLWLLVIILKTLPIMLSCYPFSFKTCFISAFSLAKSSLLVIMETASTTIFSKSCNFMKSSKIVSKYHLSIKFLCSKKTVFSISDKLKTRTFK